MNKLASLLAMVIALPAFAQERDSRNHSDSIVIYEDPITPAGISHTTSGSERMCTSCIWGATENAFARFGMWNS
jgi:hypothetical protein